jgi:hypothetical protein
MKGVAMTESGIAPNAVELPCDCQPAEPQPYVSYLLTLPPRSLSQAVADVSRVRDLDPFVYELLWPRVRTTRAADNVVVLASRRRA